MTDRRIREHTLDAVLRDRGEVAEDHRERGDDRQDVLPVETKVRHADVEDPREDREGRGFRCRGEKRRDRSRRAFVNVRSPHVERHRGDLEAESRAEQHDAEHQRVVRDQRGHGVGDAQQVERAGDAVDQRDAVQQNRRAHRAEHEVLHRRFGRLLFVLEVAGEDVARQRHQLEADVDRGEMDARGHEHHAAEGEGHERVVLPGGVARAAQKRRRRAARPWRSRR